MSNQLRQLNRKKYLHQYVEIKTKQGQTYRGTIIKISSNKVYLKVDAVRSGKKAHVSFCPFILPLVLFNLLVIVLLESKPRRCC